MTARRRLLIASGLVALSASLPAQPQERRVRRIGFFFSGNAKNSATSLAAFCEGMAELRWHGPASSASRKKTREEEHSSYAPPPGPLGSVEVLGSIMINIMTITASFVEACNEYDHGQPLAKP